MDSGWIKIHRSILEWEWYADPIISRVFIDFLIKANHAPGKWQGYDINKGQLITSVKKIATTLRVSDKQVRRAIDKLKNTGEIETKRTNKFTFITICNYERYQVSQTAGGADKGNSQGQTKGKQRATNKNEEKKEGCKYLRH